MYNGFHLRRFTNNLKSLERREGRVEATDFMIFKYVGNYSFILCLTLDNMKMILKTTGVGQHNTAKNK